MNKINIVNNKIIPFDNNDVIINNNDIIFLCNGDYVIEYIDSDNVDITISVKDNVFIKLFEFSENNDLKIRINYNLEKNSSLLLSKFYYNNSTNEIININLNKYKANIKYNFSSISKNNDRYEMNINHVDNNTSSCINNKIVALANSSNNFDINSYVDNGILDCYLNQQTKIVTLGESNNKINPNMFTHENSTTAIHSSVIGTVSSDDLFYLMTRGIDYKKGINLIIKGIIFSNIIASMEMKERIFHILNEIGGE